MYFEIGPIYWLRTDISTLNNEPKLLWKRPTLSLRLTPQAMAFGQLPEHRWLLHNQDLSFRYLTPC